MVAGWLFHVSMLWDLASGEMDLRYLMRGLWEVLGKAANRHWRDMLVAMYAEASTEA